MDMVLESQSESEHASGQVVLQGPISGRLATRKEQYPHNGPQCLGAEAAAANASGTVSVDLTSATGGFGSRGLGI